MWEWWAAAGSKNDGSLWSWGENHLGILGDGINEDRWEPQMVIDSDDEGA